MITVYHLLQSRSERVIWLLEELGEPYELKAFKRDPDMSAPAAYRALHPMGTSPIIRDGAITLVETGAIVEYILDRYGRGRLQPPRGTPEHALYLQWMHFAEGSAAASILTGALLDMATAKQEPSPRVQGFVRLWRERNERMMPYLESVLAEHAYIAGPEFTAADIMMAYTLGLYERFLRQPLTGFPQLLRYRDQVTARPAYAKAEALAAKEPEPA